MPRSEVMEESTSQFIKNLSRANRHNFKQIAKDVFNKIRDDIEMENAVLAKSSRYKVPQDLPNRVIATLMLELLHIVRIKMSPTGKPVLAIYIEDGDNKGVYDTENAAFFDIIKQFNADATESDVKAVMYELDNRAPVVEPCEDKDLIPMHNGIFNYDTKTLIDFDPKYVFTAKFAVDFNPNATNPVIHNNDDGTDWDIDSWISDLSDDPEIVGVLWQVIGAIMRPLVRWDKAVFFYNTVGNNGKGTLCELLKTLVGNYATMSLKTFNQEFGLQQLIGNLAVICDENDVRSLNENLSNFKSAVTGDTLLINIKNKNPIQWRFTGLIVQCFNDIPSTVDKTDSLYRRQLFVPFDKCFTGRERKYIKSDYMHRKEVLEYVAYKVLVTMPSYYRFDEPDACLALLEQVKESNSPVRQFYDDVMPDLTWDLLPRNFVYDLYKSWFTRTNPSGRILGRNSFLSEFTAIVAEREEWIDMGPNKIRPDNKMDNPELLISQYDLKEWMNPMYRGTDLMQICKPALKDSYRGFVRK